MPSSLLLSFSFFMPVTLAPKFSFESVIFDRFFSCKTLWPKHHFNEKSLKILTDKYLLNVVNQVPKSVPS